MCSVAASALVEVKEQRSKYSLSSPFHSVRASSKVDDTAIVNDDDDVVI